MVSITDPNNIILSSKRKETVIFCDLDGVISDFNGGVLKLFNLNEDKDVLKGLELGKSFEDFVFEDKMWDKINNTKDFWETLDIFPWAKKLIDTIKNLGDFHFLSSPGNIKKHGSNVGNATLGKCKWVAKNFPGLDLILIQDKYLCAKNNCILIDDTEKKIKPFAENGGKIYHFPNQFLLASGKINFDDVLQEIVEKIKNI